MIKRAPVELDTVITSIVHSVVVDETAADQDTLMKKSQDPSASVVHLLHSRGVGSGNGQLRKDAVDHVNEGLRHFVP